jgi:hypothetical protein
MTARCCRASLFVLLAATAPLAAQEAPEPLPLTLPPGAHARLTSTAVPGLMHGLVVRNDDRSVTFMLENGGLQAVPISSLTRLDIATSKKRHFWQGALVGLAVGVAFGFAFDVDPYTCHFDTSTTFCSRGSAVAAGAAIFGLVGLGAGALIQTDQWTPVDLKALGPPPPRVSFNRELGPSLGVTIRF